MAELLSGLSYSDWKSIWDTYGVPAGWTCYLTSQGQQAVSGNLDWHLVTSPLDGSDLDSFLSDFDGQGGNHSYTSVVNYVGAAASISMASGFKPEKRDDARPSVAVGKRSSAERKFYTFQWTDKTSWYEQSARIVDEEPMWNGAMGRYELSNSPVVDTHRWKILSEEYAVDAAGNPVTVDVREGRDPDPLIQKVQTPWQGTAADYTVDYENGYIIPHTPNWDPQGTPITVTYSLAQGSTFTVKPAPGKVLDVNFVKVIYSPDIEINDAVVFQARGLVEVFAPWLTPVPYPAGTLIPLPNPLTYNTFDQFLADATRIGEDVATGISSTTPRGSTLGRKSLEFDYLHVKKLIAAYGMEIQICLQNDIEFGGEFAAATLVCSSEDWIP